jgi:hypothetical protein
MPQIRIDSPVSGETVKGKFAVQVAAIFGNAFIMKLLVDRAVEDTIDVRRQSPWVFFWSTHKHDNGPHKLIAELVYDDGSIAATSAPVDIVVAN